MNQEIDANIYDETDIFERRFNSFVRFQGTLSNIIEKYTNECVANEGKETEVIYTEDLGVTNKTKLTIIDEGQTKFDFLCRDDFFDKIPSETNSNCFKVPNPVSKSPLETRKNLLSCTNIEKYEKKERKKKRECLKLDELLEMYENNVQIEYEAEQWWSSGGQTVRRSFRTTSESGSTSGESRSGRNSNDTSEDQVNFIGLDEDDRMDTSDHTYR